jgi:GntR family transcriptional regulator, transcriptional repressor for pyruvate dehydrogenase complex
MTPSREVPALGRRALDEQIAASIVDGVVAGRYPPGSALPAERDLAEQLGVNRTSLRQALARLEQMGLIESRQGSGNVVRNPTLLTDPAVVRAMGVRPDPALVGELIEMREALGTFIGRLAADRATPEDLDRIDAAVASVAAAEDSTARQEAELEFFGALIAATGNRPLALLLRWVESAYGFQPPGFVRAFDDGPAITAGLRRIGSSVRDGETDASAMAVQDYLRDSGRRMLEAVVPEEPFEAVHEG